jgi:septal ring factor EnvC (AmiA/AmiB activator)
MKGMHGGHNQNAKNECEQPSMSAQDLQSMSAKMTELTEQNASLLKEVQTLKKEMSALTADQKIH